MTNKKGCGLESWTEMKRITMIAMILGGKQVKFLGPAYDPEIADSTNP